MSAAEAAKQKPAHPFWFFILALPIGIVQGYLSVTLAWFYRREGMSVQQISVLVGLSLLPLILKFLWAPLVDFTLSVKKWFLISNFISSVSLVVLSFIPGKPANIPILTVIILISYLGVTFVTLSVTSLMAYDTPAEEKGRAGGWYNAGSVGGIGIGGGLGLWVAQYIPSQWQVAGVLLILCLICSFGLVGVKEPVATTRVEKMSATLKKLFSDIWAVIKVKSGILALLLSLLPLGTGAVGTLFAAMAKDWHASQNAVAFTTGMFGGVITVAGCLIGGWLCDAINRRLAYLLFGAFQAVCALGMAFCPHNQTFYVAWTLIYAFSNGFTYAGFSAFVLEVIGKGAAATKYNLYAGIGNIPIYAVTVIDGWANTQWGSNGTLVIEAVITAAAIILFFIIQLAMGVKTTMQVKEQ